MHHPRFLVMASALAASLVLSSAPALAATEAPSAPLARTGEENRILQSAGVRVNQQSGVPPRNDFAMGPGRVTLDMAPGEQKTIEVQVDSTTQGLRSYMFETEDFGMAQDGSDSTTLYGASSGPYPARSWVHPAVPSIRLNFGERAFVPVTITIPKSAEPGDSYAALLLRRALEPGETTDRGFNIVSRVGTLFLVTVKGEVKQDAQISSLTSRKKLYWFFPAFLHLEAKNNGTVYAQPSGAIQIRNILGLVVDEIPVSDWYVLRQSSRGRDFEWHPRFALGRYTATAKLSAYGKELPVAGTSFWMIPALPVLIVVLAIFAVSFIVQFFLSRFEIRKKK